MKVVLITHHGKAGVFESTNRLAAALAHVPDDHVTVISPRPHEPAPPHVAHLAWDGSVRGFFSPRIGRALAAADCIVSTQRRVEVLLALCSFVLRRPRYISIIRDNPCAVEYRRGPATPLLQWLWQAHLRRCTHIVAISHYIREAIRGFAPDLLPRTHVIHNGVETPAAVPALSRPAVPPRIRLCALGRLDHDKRPLDAFTLFTELDRLGVDYSFTWIGGGGLEADFQRAADQHPGGRSIRATGFLAMPEAMAQLAACDVLVHFRCDEGFGLALIEALAHGIPVAGFHAGALPEIITDPLAGALAPVGDFAAFAHNVVQVAQRSSPTACVRIAEKFNMRHEADAYLRLIHTVGP
jgi:glycosyltransferase involved in cell wall biosynthesis